MSAQNDRIQDLQKQAHALIRQRAELILATEESTTPFRAAELAIADAEELAATLGLDAYALASELVKAQAEADAIEKRKREHARFKLEPAV